MPRPPAAVSFPLLSPADVDAAAARLIERHGDGHATAIARGVRQVAERWWREDGDAVAFGAFCDEHFVPEAASRDETFARLEAALEQIDGLLHEMHREVRRPIDTVTGPIRTIDLLLGNIDLHANVEPDLYRTRVAFLALLNFEVHTLEERLRDGPRWDRAAWARSCLMDRFAVRVPAEVAKEATRALNEADVYISQYDLLMDRIVAPDGRRLFPDGLRLISHWGLRDELKANYAAGPEGLEKQRTIQRIMERILRQEIPNCVRANPDVVWCPETNEVTPANGAAPGAAADAREPDTRYARLLGVFHAAAALDPYAPAYPTFMRRRFDLGRQMLEENVESLLVALLEAPELDRLAARIAQRLGRPLEPFDVWYAGYQPRAEIREEDLDATARERFPSARAFQEKLPEVLEGLGFSPVRSRWLADRIVVDSARGSGHALGAQRREDKAHLRTRVPDGGMSFQGYNVAMHELGHNVEQVFSLHGIDHWALNGVPNTAFTEAFAFTFQERDLELLGLATSDESSLHAEALHALWKAAEIAGVSLVDMAVWNWLYAHPKATPAETRDAVLAAARNVWNRFFAARYRVRDIDLFAIYSHIVNAALYLPDYAIGELVAFQISRSLRDRPFGAEVERQCRLGRLTPDAWMQAAVGSPVSAEPLLEAARDALAAGA